VDRVQGTKAAGSHPVQIDRFFTGPGARGDQWQNLVKLAEAWSDGSGSRAKFETALGEMAVTEGFYAYPGLQLMTALRDQAETNDAQATTSDQHSSWHCSAASRYRPGIRLRELRGEARGQEAIGGSWHGVEPVTTVPLVLGMFVGKYLFRFDDAIVLRCCAGARTTTAALGVVSDRAKSQIPGLGLPTQREDIADDLGNGVGHFADVGARRLHLFAYKGNMVSC
jgi:Predicted Permease Membrane Region